MTKISNENAWKAQAERLLSLPLFRGYTNVTLRVYTDTLQSACRNPEVARLVVDALMETATDRAPLPADIHRLAAQFNPSGNGRCDACGGDGYVSSTWLVTTRAHGPNQRQRLTKAQVDDWLAHREHFNGTRQMIYLGAEPCLQCSTGRTIAAGEAYRVNAN